MLQHVLLTMVAAPLLWVAAPAVPLLRGLPPRLARDGFGPFLAWPALQRLGRGLVHPLVAGPIFAVAIAGWHLPGPYQLALRSPAWHAVEHACFLLGALLFWFPVVQPWPSVPHWPRWAMIPYLLIADVENTVLSALLAFSDRVVYPLYGAAPRLWSTAALGDQMAAGALMWVAGSAAYLVPAALIVRDVLEPRLAEPPAADRRGGSQTRPSLSVGRAGGSETRPYGWLQWARVRRPAGSAPAPRFDLLIVPLIGRFLRWRHGRHVLQIGMCGLALALIADGLFGPPMSPMNLAGVLPWTYWRGAVVAALLVAGNVFCMACPFMLPRAAAKRLFPAGRAWPRALRGKWLAVALLVAYLWAYEAFALWDSPWWTACIALAYFATAFTVDALFRGASFCKYVCPIGQFNFVGSLVSPLEVRVREPRTCATCSTRDCIRGNAVQRGCELDLFQPEKRGNLDCTFCLDCVHACPHDNVGILAAAPLRELARDPYRSSLRRLSERPDIAALAVVSVFGAFANAAGMVAPVVDAQQRVAAHLGLASSAVVVTAGLALALLAAPAAALSGAAWWSARFTYPHTPARALGCRFALALVPLGLTMWAAHFLFHLAGGAATAWPVAQRIAGDLGSALLGTPAWGATAAFSAPDQLTAFELLLLDGGLLASLYVGWQIARHEAGQRRRALALLAPWAALMIGLWAMGAWIVFQPMQMRGMVH
jgi:hypothetical protein